MNPTQLPAWQTLTGLAHQEKAEGGNSPQRRAQGPVLKIGGVLADFSRQQIATPVLDELLNLANQSQLAQAITAQLAGDKINASENRAVLHTALRAPHDARPSAVAETIEAESERLAGFVTAVRTNQWRGYTGKAIQHVVHIGIGGSHLGPELAYRALAKPTDPLKVSFLANLDGHAARDALHGLNPETTLFIVVSKSFSTLETKMNANTARNWFIERTGDLAAIKQHFVAVTSNLDAAADFGMPKENLFAMWDWVGCCSHWVRPSLKSCWPAHMSSTSIWQALPLQRTCRCSWL